MNPPSTAPPTPLKLSVVVPAFNEEKLLGETLASIQAAGRAAFDAAGWGWELVVCNNNSTDRTPDIARAAGARVVFEPVNQIGRARNAGAGAAVGEWLLFVDADSRPSAGLLEAMRRAIDSGRILGGGSTLRMETEERIARFMTWGWNRVSRFRRWAAGSFIFVEAAAFRAVGGFHQELYVSEEIELSKRLNVLARAQGREFLILHRHPMPTSARKLSLYTKREHLRFLWQMIRSRGGSLRDRERCFVWYDGRR